MSEIKVEAVAGERSGDFSEAVPLPHGADAPSGAPVPGPDLDPRVIRALQWGVVAASVTVALVCGLLLVGWSFGHAAVASLNPSDKVMNPVAAVTFILVAMGMLMMREAARPLLSYRLGLLCALVVCLVGSLKLLGYVGPDLQVDRLLFSSELEKASPPNRMAANTAIFFVLSGLGLLLADVETRSGKRPSQALAAMITLFGMLGLTGYIYGVSQFYGGVLPGKLSLVGTTVWILLGVGLLCLRPRSGIMGLVASTSDGGVTVRTFLTAAVGLPLLLGWLKLLGERWGLYSHEMGAALVTLGMMAIFSWIVWRNGASLDALDLERRRAEADLKRSTEELRRARDAAEAASRAKSTFLANMSHEIRTPLNAVIGMTDLVLDSPLTTRQREFLSTVRDAGEGLLAVISDILDFSRIEAGKLPLHPSPFSLRDSLGDTMKSLALRAHEKGLELACRIHPDAPRTLVGDYARVRQVLVNLLGNALKFTEAGEIVLEVTVDSASPEQVVLHFTVRDTGIGIQEDRLGTIFEKFEQVDNSMTRRHGGTGLGLAIASRLLELMGGEIWVESRVGEGSCFHFRLGFDVVTPQEAAVAVHEPVVLHGMRVLVVDDNRTNRRILEEMLNGWRMEPSCVASVGEAMAYLSRECDEGRPCGLILTDVNMPGEDGFSLVARIRSDPRLAGAVVVVLTSGERLGDVERCEELGVAAHLLKPVKQSELLVTLLEAVGAEGSGRVSPPVAAASRLAPLRVLLAEDSPVNQKLVRALLEGQRHHVTVVDSGRAALAALEAQAFDVVLMDVQMPEMDGLEAAQVIRERERETGHHLPIIALTAHALQGDREGCFEAGMDAYIAKPIHVKELVATLEEVLSGTVPESPAEGPDVPVVQGLDWGAALDAADQDEDLLRTVVGLTLEQVDRLGRTCHDAVNRNDASALLSASHMLKGTVRIFGVTRVYELLQQLEKMGRARNLKGGVESMALFDLEVPAFRRALELRLRAGLEERGA